MSDGLRSSNNLGSSNSTGRFNGKVGSEIAPKKSKHIMSAAYRYPPIKNKMQKQMSTQSLSLHQSMGPPDQTSNKQGNFTTINNQTF